MKNIRPNRRIYGESMDHNKYRYLLADVTSFVLFAIFFIAVGIAIAVALKASCW